jgi:hypothetical protein
MFIIVYSTTLTLFRIYFRNIPLSNRNSKERPEEALHRAAKKKYRSHFTQCWTRKRERSAYESTKNGRRNKQLFAPQHVLVKYKIMNVFVVNSFIAFKLLVNNLFFYLQL